MPKIIEIALENRVLDRAYEQMGPIQEAFNKLAVDVSVASSNFRHLNMKTEQHAQKLNDWLIESGQSLVNEMEAIKQLKEKQLVLKSDSQDAPMESAAIRYFAEVVSVAILNLHQNVKDIAQKLHETALDVTPKDIVKNFAAESQDYIYFRNEIAKLAAPHEIEWQKLSERFEPLTKKPIRTEDCKVKRDLMGIYTKLVSYRTSGGFDIPMN